MSAQGSDENQNAELVSVQRKRLLSEDEQQQESSAPSADTSSGNQDKKKGRYNPYENTAIPAALTTIPGIVSYSSDTLIAEIAPDKVAHVIGSKGQIIQEIQSRTGCKAYVNQEFPPGVNRHLHLTGNVQQIRAAADLVQLILDNGPTAIHVNSLHGGPQTTRIIECSLAMVGKVIGSGGSIIKDIQSKSGAKIQIDQDFPPEVPRKINISGSVAAVNSASELIQQQMVNASKGPPNNYSRNQSSPAYPALQVSMIEVTQIIDVPKSTVGKLIGKGGENIQILQKKSGCRITIDQKVPDGAPCKVTMTGNSHNIGIAQHLVQEMVQGVHISRVGANAPVPITGPPSTSSAPASAPPAPYMGGYGMPPNGPAGPYMSYPPYPNHPGGAPPMGYGYPPAPGYGYPPPYGMPPGSSPMGHNPYGYPMHPTPAPAAAPAPTSHNAPAPVPAKPAPSVWTEHKTEDGLSYWYNTTTGVSQVFTV